MTMTSSPPIRTSSMTTTVPSGLNVRLASLYGSVMRSDFVHAVHHLNQCRIHFVRSHHTEDGAVDARRSVHVHARVDQRRDDLLDLRLGRALFHHHHHGYRSSPFPACLCAVARSMRRASSMMRSNTRTMASPSSGLPVCLPCDRT